MSGSGNVQAARIRTSGAMGGASSGRGAVKSAKPKSLAEQMSKGSGGGKEPGRRQPRSNIFGKSYVDAQVEKGTPRQVAEQRLRDAKKARSWLRKYAYKADKGKLTDAETREWNRQVERVNRVDPDQYEFFPFAVPDYRGRGRKVR